jgi:S1-C subfamily serine protease
MVATGRFCLGTDHSAASWFLIVTRPRVNAARPALRTRSISLPMTPILRARRTRSVTVCACLALLANSPSIGFDSALAKEPGSRRMTDVVIAVRAARPAVVNIQGQKTVPAAVQAAGTTEVPHQVNGMGTGVIIDERGYILTNYHVVADVRHILVTLDDHRQFTAELIARDAAADLAVVKIPATEQLPVISIGTSNDLMEGEPVIAIGNAFGYEHTVTRGIVSALGRDVQVSDTQTYDNLIQTDASINPGNSGGPLLNVDGQMIGLNVAVRAGAQGIGFAIPVDHAMEVAARIMSVEQLQNKWHGLVTQAGDQPGGPLVVADVESSSPAANAGLKPGDAIRTIGHVSVTRPLDLERALLDCPAGEAVPVEVERGGQTLTLDLALASRLIGPIATHDGTATDAGKSWDLLGLELSEEPKSTFQKRSTRYRGGMRVVDVRPDGPAAQQGIEPGDILVGMHRWETASPQDIDYIVTRPNLAQMGPLKFYVLRGKTTLYGHLDVATTIATAPGSTTRH